MNVHHDGGPAFPSDGPADAVSYWGMSLRDYFAAQALAGWLADGASGRISSGLLDQTDFEAMRETLARGCYAMADAMLKERAK